MVYLGYRKAGGSVARLLAGVVLLTVEDGGMEDGTAYGCAPVLGVSAKKMVRAVGIGQFENSTESTFA